MTNLFPFNTLKPIYDIINEFFALFFVFADESFFLAVFPYMAIIIALYGIWHRYRSHEFSQTSQSSQFLNRTYSLPQALNFFHYGIIVVLSMHFLLVVFALLIPDVLNEFFLQGSLLMYVEIFLWALSVGIIIGMTVFMVRRIMNSRARAVTTKTDWFLYILLFTQVTLGFLVATGYYPGMQWYASSIVPWFVSLVTLAPNTALISSFDPMVRFHILNGFTILAVLPYTRLFHFLSLPYGYLLRKYQISIWYSKRKPIDNV